MGTWGKPTTVARFVVVDSAFAAFPPASRIC